MWSECDNDCCSSANSMGGGGGGGGNMRIAFNYAFSPRRFFIFDIFSVSAFFVFCFYSTLAAADAVLLLVGYQANRKQNLSCKRGLSLFGAKREKKILVRKMKGEAILTFNCRAEWQCQLVFGIFVSPSLSPGCLRLTMCSQWCTHHKSKRDDQIDAFSCSVCLLLCLSLAVAENFAGRIRRPIFFF